ncbi:MAG: hypothetical protein ACN4GG_12140 [Akkermansiaceae bacterium]
MQTKFKLQKIVPLLLVGGLLPAAEVTVFEEDFEGAGDFFVPGNAAITSTDLVPDPEAGGTRGTVLEVSLSGVGQWGGLSASDGIFDLVSLGIAPGTDNYTFTADIFIPSTTLLDGEARDRAGVILRFIDADETDNLQPQEKFEVASNFVMSQNPTLDTWQTVTLTGQIPETYFGGRATTHVRPIVSVRDENPDQTDLETYDTAVYFDNIKFVAQTSGEDPNLSGAQNSKFGILSPGGDVTVTYEISNTGLSNDLVISSAALSGNNADLYTVNTTFPLTINPTSSAQIEVTFNSANDAASYAASLELTTNDVSDPTYTLDLSAIIYEPGGEELIINGGFETGNTLGFSSGATFEAIAGDATIPAKSGDYYASYTLPGGSEWGSFELNQPSPPNVEGSPNQITITPEMIGQPYTFRCFYYRPAENGIGDEDAVQMIMRWNGTTPDSPPWTSFSGGLLGTGEWIEYIEEGIVPANWPEDANPDTPEIEPGDPVTSAFPIFSVRDIDANLNPDGGQRIFVDDMSFIVNVPVIELPVYPVITVFARENADGSSTLTWTSKPGQTYRIEFSEDLDFWIELEEEFPALDDSETTTWTDNSSNGVDKRFYRVIFNEAPVPAE